MSSPGALPASVSFAAELWDGFAAVCEQSKNGQRTLDKIAYYMKEKAALDMYYSKTLKKLASSALGSLEGTTFQSALTQFEGMNTILAENHEILAAKMVEQVKKPLELLKETLTRANKMLFSQGETLVKQHKDAHMKLEKSRTKAEAACRASLAARKAAKLASDSEKERAGVLSDPDQLAQLAQNSLKAKKKAQDLSREAIVCDRSYMADVRAIRGFRDRHDHVMGTVLHQLEQVEINRLNGVAASMRHYMTIQLAMTESIHKTVGVVSGMLSRMDATADMREFIVNHISGRAPEALPEYEQFEGHPMGPLLTDEEYSGRKRVETPSDELPEEHDDDSSQLDVKSGVASDRATGSKKTLSALSSFFSSATGSILRKSSSRPKDGGLNSELCHDDKTVGDGGDDRDEVLEFDAGRVKVPVSSSSGVESATGTGYVVVSNKDISSQQRDQRSDAEFTFSSLFSRILSGPVTKSLDDDVYDIVDHPSQTDSSAETKTSEQRLSVDIGDTELDGHAVSLFGTAEGREAFASVLNQKRSTNESLHLSKHAFDVLGSLIMLFLDKAQESLHVRPAQLVMIMSQTFYYVPEEPANDLSSSSPPRPAGSQSSTTKIYLQERIKSHSIWSSMRFWEEAFFDSYTVALAKHNKTQVWHSDVEQADARQSQRNIVFAQLGTFAHNMAGFGMDVRKTKDFIAKMCSINDLDREVCEVALIPAGGRALAHICSPLNCTSCSKSKC